MRFDFITIFPQIFDCYFGESILKRAARKRLVSFHVHDLRKWTTGKHKTADDKPYGGGPGMVMKIEPIYRALYTLKASKLHPTPHTLHPRIILLSAKGKQFTQVDAVRLAKKHKRLIFICGRYEGVDERVAKYLADEELSIGPYVLTGGELAAMVIADAVSRHIPGVLGKAESLIEESFSLKGAPLTAHRLQQIKEYPQYTRPEIFYPFGEPRAVSRKRKAAVAWRVPKILLSGDHKKIAAWRMKKRLRVTAVRPRAR